ncbi:MAG: hypothetical protein ACHP7N_03970 [Caulobacterales bacterium]
MRPLLAMTGAVVLAISGVCAPQIAAADPAPPPAPGYEAQSHYDYDACQKAKADHGVAGAIIGGLLGGLFGSNIAAGGHRTGGTLIGAGVGALGGAAVGSSTANCDVPPPPPPPLSYQDRSGPNDQSYDHDRYDDRDQYDRQDDRYADAPQDAGPPPPDERDCAMAESPIYMPDGSVRRSYVHVCRDENGRYQVVE